MEPGPPPRAAEAPPPANRSLTSMISEKDRPWKGSTISLRRFWSCRNMAARRGDGCRGGREVHWCWGGSQATRCQPGEGEQADGKGKQGGLGSVPVVGGE